MSTPRRAAGATSPPAETSHDPQRRRWLVGTGTAAFGLLTATAPFALRAAAESSTDVLAAEDMMREHGVLRRALLVYAHAAVRLARNQPVAADALQRTAMLFRRFGEDYHEHSLEETHVFPALAAGPHAALVKTLIAQHRRGREITDYLLAVTHGGNIGSGDVAPLAGVLGDFVRMYQHHTAIEDTVLFPAWKRTLSSARYRELSEQFEDLEQRMFGKHGFEDAVARIAAVEQSVGLADLAALTAAAPPARPALSRAERRSSSS